MNERFVINTEKIKNAWEYAKWRTYSDAYDAMVLSGEINYKVNCIWSVVQILNQDFGNH